MNTEASGSDALLSVERHGTSSKGVSERLAPSIVRLLKTVDKQYVPLRPKKFRTYQHLLWFAHAVQVEVQLCRSAASIATARADTLNPDLAAILADGETRFQRQVQGLRNELRQAAGAALQELARVQSVLGAGKGDIIGSQVSAVEHAQNLVRLLPPYRDLLSKPLSQEVPRHGEKLAEALMRLVLAVAHERGMAVPSLGMAEALTRWQRDQLDDEAERNLPTEPSRRNGWASLNGNVSLNAWPIRDPRARRF